MSSADNDLARVRAERPLVVPLARVLSLAAHIDVALVRALRLRLFTGADVSTEADLWSSPLVQSRGEGDLVLRSDVRQALWRDLREAPSALADAWAALEEVRTDARPLVVLEERLTYYALAGDAAAIDRELRAVIAAMRDEPARRRDLAAWSAQALAQLPREVYDAEAARILGNVAGSWVATPRGVAAMAPDVDSMDLVQALQPDSGRRVTIYVRRVGDVLEVSTESRPPDVAIPGFSATNPTLFVDHDQPWRIDLRGVTRIPVRAARVMIGTPDRRRWWIEPRQEEPSFDSIRTIHCSDGVWRVIYLVSPGHAVTSSIPENIRRELSFLSFSNGVRSEMIAIDEEAGFALFRLDEQILEQPLELEPEVQPGQTWQAFLPTSAGRIVGTVATSWPDVMLRMPVEVTAPLPPGTPIFVGTKVIAHVGSEPIGDDRSVHATSAKLIRRRLDQVMAASPGDVRVWVQSMRSPEVPREAMFQGAANAQKGDLVVAFAEDDRLRWPAGIYGVVGGRRSAIGAYGDTPTRPTSTELRCELVLELPRPPDKLLFSLQRQIAAYAEVTSQRDTRNLGIHDGLRDLLLELGELGERAHEHRAQLLRLLGGPVQQDGLDPEPGLVESEPVVIELPHRISTGGLLGTTLASEGEVRHFRGHRWGAHDVSVVVAPARPGPDAIRIKISSVEIEPRSATMELALRRFHNRGKELFNIACDAAARSFMAEMIAGPRRGSTTGEYDLEIVVNRVPHVPPAHAYRRGIQFVLAALDAMDVGGRSRRMAVGRRQGLGTLDLVEAQRRVRATTKGDQVTLVWIDPETDTVELRFGDTPHVVLDDRVERGLGGPLEDGFDWVKWRDPIVHRFGSARERSRRRVDVEYDEALARVSVRATDDRPVCGYVAFYATGDASANYRIEVVRARASQGVARCELPRRGQTYAIGAVVEDEGIVLEHRIDQLGRHIGGVAAS